MSMTLTSNMELTNFSSTNLINDDPVSPALARSIMTVVLVIICGLVGVFGIGANIVNIIVFVRQGFKDGINISLLGLAVADLMCVVSTCWMRFTCSPFFAEFDLPFNAYDLTYVTGTWSRVLANRITSFINAFIALERCLCIAMPLKVKIIITPLKTKVINISIFVAMFIVFSPFYYVNKLEWRYNRYFNRTLLTLVFTEDREIVDSVTFVLHSVTMPALCLICIVCCTVILVVKLNKKAKWRQRSTITTASKHDTPSRKEQQVVKMVTFISTIFIVCYLPATFIFIVMVVYPEFGVSGKYVNMYYVVWVLTICLETVNSSVNIFVYVKMSSKFRNMFLVTCCCAKKI